MSKNRIGIIRGSYKKIKCEYCGTETTPGNYKKLHGINCKHK